MDSSLAVNDGFWMELFKDPISNFPRFSEFSKKNFQNPIKISLALDEVIFCQSYTNET